MNEGIQATLLALKDVPGVQGSFVLSEDGSLLAMEMPPLFDDSLLSELGPRIERLSESFSALGDELDSCTVRFSDHVLCIKKFTRGGTLCILTSHGVNFPALKMAINLAGRRVSNAILGPQPAPPAPPLPAPPATSTSGAAANRDREGGPSEPSRKIPRYYRGQLVED